MNGEILEVQPSQRRNIPGIEFAPDPIPFDMDEFLYGWNSLQPIEKMAENKINFTKVMHSFSKPFLAQGYNSLAALNRGSAGFYAHLDSIADFVEASGFGKKEGLFEKMAQISTDKADYWKERAEKVGIGFLDELVSEAVGSFVPGVTKFSMDVASGFTFPYMAGAAEAAKKGEQPFAAGIVEAAKTGVLYGVFKMMSPLKKYLQAPTMGTIFGLQEMEGAPEGQKAKAFAKGAGIGLAYSLASPGGRLGLNEVKKNLEPEIAKIVEANKRLGERGAIEIKKPKEPETRPRKFLKTVEEAIETASEIKERLEKMPEQAKDYYVQPNKESLEKADLRIQAEGTDKTVDYVLGKESLSAEKGATFIRLMENFQKQGDYDRAIQMIEGYDTQLREAGRFVQAASIWNKLSPPGFVRWAEKQLEATKEKYSWVDTVFNRKPELFTLSKEEKTEIFQKMTEIEKMPEGIEKADATLELIDKVAQKVPPSVSEMIDSFRYQNMLSSPKTHMRNIGENVLNTFMTRPIDLTTRGAYDWVKSTLFKKDREAYVSDVPVYMKSSINAVPNALKAFVQTWGMESGTTIGKPELGIEAKTEFQRARTKQMPSWLTIVPRFMESSDKFNSALIGAGEFAIQKKRGATDAEAYERASRLAEKYLYRDKLDPKDKDLSYFSVALSELGDFVQNTRKYRVVGKFSQWFVPFIRTPINKSIQMVEHSPLGLARADFNNEAMSKIIAGGLFTGLGAIFALEGKTTWSPPSDPKEKELFYASGRKPFSVEVGNKWIPVWYLGPFALSFGIPAAIKHIVHDRKQALTEDAVDKLLHIAEAIAQFTGSQTSTQSLGSLFSALHGDIDYSFESQTAFTLEQIIPGQGLIRYINTILDPVYRKPQGFLENIEKDLPFLSKSLEARMTPFLEESKRETRNYFLPYDVGKTKDVYDVLMPRQRWETRQKYLQNKVEDIIKKRKSGEITVEESMKQWFEIIKAQPKSFEHYGQELIQQEGGKEMISAENPRAPHVGDGVEDTFSYDCRIFQETDLLVYVDDVLQPYPTAYTVDMDSDGIGGNVIFEAAYIPADDAVIDIVRSTPLTQGTDLEEGGRFSAEIIEATFDKQMMAIQDLDSKVSLLIAEDGSPIPANTVYAFFPFEDVREFTDLNEAVSTISTTQATLVVANAQTLSASLTIPSTLSLIVLKGGLITKASTYTLTIQGPFQAGLHSVFSGFDSGDVTFAANTVPFIHHQWFGETTGSHAKSTAAGTAGSVPVFCDYPLDTDITFSDNTTGDASASKHGFLAKLENSGSKYLKDDGTWDTPGAQSIIQVVNSQTGAVDSGTTVMPADDTIPQKTEGDEYMTLAITPTSATNALLIEVVCCLSPNVNSAMVVALFQDTTANALAAVFEYIAANQYSVIVFRHYMVAGTTSETTFKIRAGSDAAGTTTFNGVGGARKYGGVLASSITITEIVV